MSILSVVCDDPKANQFVFHKPEGDLPSPTVSTDDEKCTADVARQPDCEQNAEMPFSAISPCLYGEPDESADAVTSEPLYVRIRCYSPQPGRWLPRD